MFLTPTERTFGEDIRPLAGTTEALAAARAGDVKRLDELELAWRNAWGPLPTPPKDWPVQLLEENGWQLVALAINRNHGPRGETVITWGFVDPCPRCWRRWRLRPRCHKCGGRGYVNDETALFHTDLDCNVLEAR